MDYVVVVTSYLGLKIERVLAKGELTREEFLERAELQWPDDEKIQLADFVIQNNGSHEDLLRETKKTYNLLI